MQNKKAEMLSKRNYYRGKSAAMFGLDARIALAIFGALSVITGAALYKAIGTAKVTADIAEMNEINKAVEAYMLDTGVDLPVYADPYSYRIDGDALVSSTGSGWKGPYLNLNYTKIGETNGIFEVKENKISIGQYSDSNWNVSSAITCPDGGNCFYWVNLAKLIGDQREYMKKIDIIIDGSDSPATGKFRVRHWTTPEIRTIGSLQGPPILAK